MKDEVVEKAREWLKKAERVVKSPKGRSFGKIDVSSQKIIDEP